jgi:hypothetical protein
MLRSIVRDAWAWIAVAFGLSFIAFAWCVIGGAFSFMATDMFNKAFPPDAEFKFGQKVEVIAGIHEGKVGTIEDGDDRSRGFYRGWTYYVDFGREFSGQHIPDYHLKAKD